LTVAAGANAVIQAIACFLMIPWGSASPWNGRYVLHDRSRVIRELTELEYHRVLALDSRVGTAILMAVFCFLVRWNWQTTEE
jgi:hypothetical protein